MSWTYHSEVFNLGFYEKHDTWQPHTSSQIISSGLISRIFEKLLNPVNDAWKWSGNALLCKAQTYGWSFQKRTCAFLSFIQCTAPASPPAHHMLMLWPTACLSHGTAEMILILPSPTRGDSFGHRGRLRLGPSMTVAYEGNSDWTGPTGLTALLSNYQFHAETSGNHSYNCCLLSLRAVAVHAPIRRLPAGLTGHPVPHFHSQPCLGAPLDGAPQLLAPCFCRDKREAPTAPRCHSPVEPHWRQHITTPCGRNTWSQKLMTRTRTSILKLQFF